MRPRRPGAPLANSPRERRVVFCADDFAQSRGITEGILALLAAGRLSAVSCLVESPLWPVAALRLRELPRAYDVGLHFNLTHDFSGARPQRPAPLPLLLLSAGVRALRRSWVEACLHAQLDRFERELARPPDFVDGHQHVHQLPVVRDALVSVLRSRYPLSGTAIRVTVPAEPRSLKGSLIARLGGYGLLDAVRQAQIPHNVDFAGIYDFSPAPCFAERMSRWLADVRDGGLIVSHPAWTGLPNGDPIARARERELAYLASASFASALRSSRVRPARFRDLSGARELH
jgi:hypothetical protein